MEESLKLAEEKYKEVLDLIERSTERGHFNALYFREPFKIWYAKEFDKRQSMIK